MRDVLALYVAGLTLCWGPVTTDGSDSLTECHFPFGRGVGVEIDQAMSYQRPGRITEFRSRVWIPPVTSELRSGRSNAGSV